MKVQNPLKGLRFTPRAWVYFVSLWLLIPVLWVTVVWDVVLWVYLWILDSLLGGQSGVFVHLPSILASFPARLIGWVAMMVYYPYAYLGRGANLR